MTSVDHDVLFRTLKIWTSAHQNGNASGPEFEQLAAEVSGKD